MNVKTRTYAIVSAILPVLGWAVALGLPAPTASAQTDFVTFETGPVRPMAVSANGDRLYVTNIPDNRLEIFDVDYSTGSEKLTHVASVPVGLEPCAIAIEPKDAGDPERVWVVNHLSDSVSIVDVDASIPRVVQTLLVGDEPRDIVFSTNPELAFVSTAHRGQHRTDDSITSNGVPGGGDPQLTDTAYDGIGRADAWVFDPDKVFDDQETSISTLGGLPERILSFFSDSARALTVDHDATNGDTVYVAGFHAGNRTSIVNERLVCDSFKGTSATPESCTDLVLGSVVVPDRASGPASADGEDAPDTGVIVSDPLADRSWSDREAQADWGPLVKFILPDHDVFSLPAGSLTSTPTVYAGVGTTLFNMVVDETDGRVFVSNNDSFNDFLFAGGGDVVSNPTSGTTVRKLGVSANVTILDPVGTPAVKPVHLNGHLLADGSPPTSSDAQYSLSTPMDMVISSSGELYVASFGTSRVGIFDIDTDLIGTSVNPKLAGSIVTRPGPAGLALHVNGTDEWLFVYSRFDNAVTMHNVAAPAIPPVGDRRVELYDYEPSHVSGGRPFLYDAYDSTVSPGNGEIACASCHTFGDTDHLAWNLGDPGGSMADTGVSGQANPQPTLPLTIRNDFPNDLNDPIHPLKGPMSTQTLRGLMTHGAMHWRGDRYFDPLGSVHDLCTGSLVPLSNAMCDEMVNLENFLEAFDSILGRDLSTPPAAADIAMVNQLTDFLLEIFMPPNPVRNLDNSLTTSQADGEVLFAPSATPSRIERTCGDCHTLDPFDGFFGTSGLNTFVGKSQLFKVPQLRNLYTKVGMSGLAMNPNFTPSRYMGNQIRGFGFGHDGAVDTVGNFLGSHHFGLTSKQREDAENFIMAFPSDLAPAVGQQVTLTVDNATEAGARITELIAAANADFDSRRLGGTVKECELVVKGVVEEAVGQSTVDVARGWHHIGGSTFANDSGGTILDGALRQKATVGHPLTYTCVPPGSGHRIGINRDNDLTLDGAGDSTLDPNPS